MLEQADNLDPAALRREVEERFSPEHMVADYVAAYEATIAATEAVEDVARPRRGDACVALVGARLASPSTVR